MRMKRRNDKGEIFRKSLCCITHSDSEESEAESNDKDNQKTEEQQKSEGKPDKSFGKREKVSNKRPQMTSAHRSKRTSHRNHSSSKNKHHERGKEHVHRKRPEKVSTAAIISTNRITRNLGIYNKAKRSDTISRENSKQKLCKKKCEDIRMKTERDMARVLDCSSFKIQHPSYSFPSGPDSPVYSNNSARMDYPTASSAISHRSQSSCSSSGRYSNPEKNKITPLRRSTPQKPRSYNEAGLAFKTPLQEISQSLTEALWPAETFHGRDYLAEVQGQLRKMYKQSSVSSHVQRMESNAGVASEFQKRCLKRKSVEENNTGSMKTATNEEKVQTVVEGLSDHLAGCKRQSTSNTYQIISSENSKQQDRFLQTIPFRDSSRGTLQSSEYFDLQAKCPSTVTRHDKGKEMDFPSCREVQRCLFGQSEASLATTSGQAQMFSHNSTSPDILDFLDGVEHTQEHRRCITPDPRLVSPPKKPTLDSLTPEKKFYPHKLY